MKELVELIKPFHSTKENFIFKNHFGSIWLYEYKEKIALLSPYRISLTTDKLYKSSTTMLVLNSDHCAFQSDTYFNKIDYFYCKDKDSLFNYSIMNDTCGLTLEDIQLLKDLYFYFQKIIKDLGV